MLLACWSSKPLSRCLPPSLPLTPAPNLLYPLHHREFHASGFLLSEGRPHGAPSLAGSHMYRRLWSLSVASWCSVAETPVSARRPRGWTGAAAAVVGGCLGPVPFCFSLSRASRCIAGQRCLRCSRVRTGCQRQQQPPCSSFWFQARRGLGRRRVMGTGRGGAVDPFQLHCALSPHHDHQPWRAPWPPGPSHARPPPG